MSATSTFNMGPGEGYRGPYSYYKFGSEMVNDFIQMTCL